jgi:exoribonuclease R
LYSNEHSVETYTDRLDNESQQDRNDRAVLIVAEWYRTHLNYRVPIILLSDKVVNVDPENGVTVMTMKEYGMDNTKITTMLDSIVQVEHQDLYEEHLPINVMESAIGRKALHRAKFNMSAHRQASVKIDGETYYVDNHNRAVHGDVVCVQVLPQNQWKIPRHKLSSDPVPTAKVVGILQRNWREYV